MYIYIYISLLYHHHHHHHHYHQHHHLRLAGAKASIAVWIYFGPFIIGDGIVLQFDLFFEKFCSKKEVKKSAFWINSFLF
jgi:hypothetical protein